VDALHGRHVDHQATGVLRRITVDRPSPRAMTPRLPAFATASAMTSTSGVRRTAAVLGAVRAQPVSDRIAVCGAVFA